jgi:hypothetical protein
LARVGAKGAWIASAGTIIRARACRALNTIPWVTALDCASEDKRVDTSTNVRRIVRIGLVPFLRRNIGKQDGVISLGNGAGSKNGPITGYLPGVSSARVRIHLNSVDVNQQTSTKIRIVIALIVTEGLVRKGEIAIDLEGGSHGQRAIASFGSTAGRYLAK